MKIDDLKAYLLEAMGKARGKKAVYPAALAATALLIIFAVFFFGRYSAMKKTAGVLKADLERFRTLEAEYLSLRAEVDRVSAKAGANGRELSSVIGSIAAGLGITDVASIKPAAERSELGYTVREAEVNVERIELNRLVNLLYRIEAHETLLSIREFSMKSRFDNPDLYDVSLRVAHIKKA